MRSSLVVLLIAACGSPSSSGPGAVGPSTPMMTSSPSTSSAATTPPEPTTTAPPPRDGSDAVVPGSASSVSNAPEITKSPGVAGGVVILWPRIPGAAKDEDARKLALKIQDRLKTLATRAYPGKQIDVRPEPERVCGRQGCTAVAVGAALIVHQGGCAVIATIAAGGTSPTTIVPWVGEMKLKSSSAAFRAPPEQEVTVTDYENCKNVEAALGGNEATIEAAIKAGK